MRKKKIFLADDEADILKVLKRFLELDGFEVTTSSAGKDALNKISSEIFDLLILDVMMPEINGWEICKKTKANPKTRNVPVIILTAKSQNVDAIMSYECGADEYATKPFDYSELSVTIKNLLSKDETK